MSIPFRVIICCAVLFSACDRDGKKTSAELLAEDTTLAMDLARANDALGEGEPDMSIGLTDDEPPARADARPAPAVAEPSVERRAPPTAVAPPPREVATPRAAASAPGCSSPAAADQQRCLLSLLARYDVELNGAYRDLIQRLRREGGAGAGEPDPASVEQLRAAQRRWLVYRDRECRRRTRSREGELWAAVRASCLGDLSDERARELSAM